MKPIACQQSVIVCCSKTLIKKIGDGWTSKLKYAIKQIKLKFKHNCHANGFCQKLTDQATFLMTHKR